MAVPDTPPACRWMDRANYTDVVVVGNGPSAISLSYFLHGYRPYYNGNSHSNALLVQKMQGSKASIVEQDLEFLSEGLEGRSPNPVALLWDALTHPDADMGAENPSLLAWTREKDKALSHIVLGKMKAGGSWQHMEGAMQTLSQNGWMELPDNPFRQWLAKRQRKLDFSNNRATTGDVRDYYEEYVEVMGLGEHFHDYHTVTSVQKVFHLKGGQDCESGEVEPCCQNIRQNHHFLWEVRGYRTVVGQHPQPRDATVAAAAQSLNTSNSQAGTSSSSSSTSSDSPASEAESSTSSSSSSSSSPASKAGTSSSSSSSSPMGLAGSDSVTGSESEDETPIIETSSADADADLGSGINDNINDNKNNDDESGVWSDGDKSGGVASSSSSSSLSNSSNSMGSSTEEDLNEAVNDLSLDREEFCFVTPNVVLATGTYDIPNRLGVSGESGETVVHSLCALERRLVAEKDDLGRHSAPLCVVGAGLSAADAILMALEAGLPVIHVFRCGAGDPGLIFRKLPQSIYPEYHRVAMLMKGEVRDELYQPYPRHCIAEIGQNMVLLKSCSSSSSSSPRSRCSSSPSSSSAPDTAMVSVDVSLTVIMVGSRPDLSFLPQGGRDLGMVPNWLVDSKHNPIDVDPFSYQSLKERGLFAMGPLIGDNFVRFGIGGALGISNYLSTREADAQSGS